MHKAFWTKAAKSRNTYIKLAGGLGKEDWGCSGDLKSRSWLLLVPVARATGSLGGAFLVAMVGCALLFLVVCGFCWMRLQSLTFSPAQWALPQVNGPVQHWVFTFDRNSLCENSNWILPTRRSSYRAPTGSACPVENPCYKTLKVHGFTAHNSDLFTHTEDETKVTCLSYFVGCKWLSWSSCMHVSSLK